MSSVIRYWCSIARTGSSSPTMRPTSRAHSPPALTTCSAWIVPFSVIDVPGAVRPLAELGRRALKRYDLGAGDLRRLGIGVRHAGRDRHGLRAGRRARRRNASCPCSGNSFAASSIEMISMSHAEIAAARAAPSSANRGAPACRRASRPPVMCMPQDWPEIASISL